MSTSVLGEMKSIIVMSIYSYLFPMCVLRKAILFFYYSSMLYFDSFEGFCRCIVDTSRRNIYLSIYL